MRAGRFACVALPIILTIGAIISFLIATLSGITHNGLYMFSVDLRNLTITADTINSIADSVNIDVSGLNRRQSDQDGISASDLGLGRSYEVTLWGYCEIRRRRGSDDTERDCTRGEFDWASRHIRTDFIDDLGNSLDLDIQLPDEIDTAIDIFSTVTRYTEIAFIVALVVLGIELVFGIFASCTRIMSCLTWLVGLAAIVVCLATAGLATAMSAVVVGAIEATASEYGVRASIHTPFLACIWIGAAFATTASLFWLFTICCCKPEHGSKKGRKGLKGGDDSEKLIPSGGYYPIESDHEMAYQNQFKPNSGAGYSHGPATSQYSSRSNVAYEPYTHH